MPNNQTSIVVDSPSLFARGWYASRRGELAEEHPSKIAAATACLHSLLHIMSREGPLMADVTRALFCWDGTSKTVKPRSEKTTEFLDDREFFKMVLDRIVGGVQAVSSSESDDAVATAAYRMADRGEDCVVISGDKDLHQAVCDHVGYYCLNKKCLLSRQHILERWAVRRPIQVGVVLAILGDTNDGVVGVTNWGPKKTAKIFEAVDDGMDLPEVVETIAAQLPPDQLDNFYSSLAVTLLRADIPDIPEPAPLAFTDPAVLDELGLGHLRAPYARFKSRYEHPPEDPSSDADETEV